MTTTKQLFGRTVFIGTAIVIVVGAATWRLRAHDDRVVVCKFLNDPANQGTQAVEVLLQTEGDINALTLFKRKLVDIAGAESSDLNAGTETKTISPQKEGVCP